MTTWVQVPVPEDLEGAVRDFVNRLTMGAALPDWDQASIDAHLRAIDPDARTLACAVAERLITDRSTELVELAEVLDVGIRELRGLLQEVNDSTGDTRRGGLLWVRPSSGDGPTPVPEHAQVGMLHRNAELIDAWQAVNGRVPTHPTG